MSKLIVLSGVASSGKSTLAKKLVEDFDDAGQYNGYVLSTDDYWLRPDGYYSFKVDELEQAHNFTFKLFEDIVDEQDELSVSTGPADYVILDNTNLCFWEFSRYAELALKNGWKVEICEPTTPWKNDADELYRRNIHGLTLDIIKRQLARKQPLDTLNRKLDELQVKISLEKNNKGQL
jgi:predicted kinase